MILPNYPFGTFVGKVFWDTLKTRNGWKIQLNLITKHFRILDPNNVSHGWATEYNEIADLFDIYSGERFN